MTAIMKRSSVMMKKCLFSCGESMAMSMKEGEKKDLSGVVLV